MAKYKVKCEVKLHGELLPMMQEIEAEDFPDAVEKVVNNIVETMDISPWDLNNFELIL